MNGNKLQTRSMAYGSFNMGNSLTVQSVMYINAKLLINRQRQQLEDPLP